MKYTVRRTSEFDKWLNKVKDPKAVKMINMRIIRLEAGNFGDHKTTSGREVSELRIDTGKGYRVYYTLRGQEIVILLCGGIKTGQSKDIQLAEKLAKNL